MNGIKDQCRREEAYDVDQLVAIANRAWKKFGLSDIQRTLRSWPSRVKKMKEASGYQTENNLEYKMFRFGRKTRIVPTYFGQDVCKKRRVPDEHGMPQVSS